MATRAIVTSQPEVECDVCGRRLLRGEQPEIFLAGGQPRTVCELCTPRAVHEGWLREAEGQHLIAAQPSRPRRGRGLLSRLREAIGDSPERPLIPLAVVEDQGGAGESPPVRAIEEDVAASRPRSSSTSDIHTQEITVPAVRSPEPGSSPPPDRDWLTVTSEDLPVTTISDPGDGHGDGRDRMDGGLDPLSAFGRALAVFNAGEHPRRVAGVTHSLGAPSINVRLSSTSDDYVEIVVAWGICWYRYGVDLAAIDPTAAVIAEGMDLAQLTDADRAPNAAADDHGEIVLVDPQDP